MNVTESDFITRKAGTGSLNHYFGFLFLSLSLSLVNGRRNLLFAEMNFCTKAN